VDDAEILVDKIFAPVPVRHTWMCTDIVDGEQCDTFETRKGRCYELAALAVMLNQVSGARLVHGSIHNEFHSTIGRIGHAWVLLPDGRVWEPIFGNVYEAESWRNWSDFRIERVYPRHRAMRLMSKTEHYGPWSKTERKGT
jgi:hypothetical protein